MIAWPTGRTIAEIVVAVVGKATLCGGALIPSMVNSLRTRDCRNTGRLFFRKPMRQGWGLAFNSRSSRLQKPSGSTALSISSWISVRTFFSTDLGSLLDKSSKLARNLRHFSLVFCWFVFCCCCCSCGVDVTTTADVVEAGLDEEATATGGTDAIGWPLEALISVGAPVVAALDVNTMLEVGVDWWNKKRKPV